MPNHGIYVTQQGTGITSPTVAASGIPFVVGTAPLGDETTATPGLPVLCNTYTEAVEAVGYDDNWEKYTLCEFIYSHFRLFNIAPVILLPLAATEADDDANTMADSVAAAMEQIELCLTMFAIVPDLICAPGFSQNVVVAAAMAAKAEAIGGMFKAKALVDLDAATYTAAIEAKNGGTFTADQIVCWPMGKLGDKTFHMSTIVAGGISATDSANDGIPYDGPSNKAAHLDSLVNSDGEAVNLTLAQANALNFAGIMTGINFMGGFVLWGNYTGCYPTNTDVKDNFIIVSRMFGWINNSLIQTFWSKLDRPINTRLIETVLDTANAWIDGLVGAGYLLGGRVEMLTDENPDAKLMAGIIKLHVYATPASPAQEIDFILEYDPDYVTTALSTEA